MNAHEIVSRQGVVDHYATCSCGWVSAGCVTPKARDTLIDQHRTSMARARREVELYADDEHHVVRLGRSGKRFDLVCCCGYTALSGKAPGVVKQWITHVESKRAKKGLAACPTPHKRRFRHQHLAEAEMARFWSRPHTGKHMPIRTYLCPCGRWHMTARPQRKDSPA